MNRYSRLSARQDVRKLFGWVAALLLWSASTAVMAQDNSIESITTTQQGGNLIVRIGLKAPPAATPASFSVASPARIAMDFPKTVNASGQNAYETNQGELRSINVVQAGERTRLVLNLKRMVSYNTAIDGNSVVVTLLAQPLHSTAPSTTNQNPITPLFAEATPDSGRHALKDIDFMRGPNGEGRVVIDLSDNQTGIDIRPQGQSIIVDFLQTALPETLRRRLNVVDFATPVQSINTFSQGDNVRMVIEPKGLWEHNAYQTDTRLVVEIKPLKEDPNKLFQGTRTGYQGERLSLNFQNVDVRSLLQVIADFTNLNIITSDSVSGNLTLRLKDVPWDQALDIILQSKGLDMRKNGNVLLVAPKDELATKEKLDLEAQQAISDLEPLQSEVFQLNYAKAQDLKDFLYGEDVEGGGGGGGGSSGGASKQILSKRGAASADFRTNQLFVQDISRKLEEVRQIVARLDVASRQVLIEARIVEADDQFSKNLGAKFGISNVGDITKRARLSGGNAVVGEPEGTIGNTPYLEYKATNSLGEEVSYYGADQNNISLPAGGLNGYSPGALAVTLFNHSFTRFLTLELNALEADGKGKVVSSPRIVTADQTKALIEQGTELPYEVATSSGATSIAFRKANLKLEVTPQITPEGNIILVVDVNKDTVGRETRAGFAIDTKHVNTKVLVENGGTVVLGGIYTQTERDITTKVPLFGDIPVVGNLFRNRSRTNDKTELLVFITPRVLNERITAR